MSSSHAGVSRAGISPLPFSERSAGVRRPLAASSALALSPFFDPGAHAPHMRWSILLLAVMLVAVAVVIVSRAHARTRRALDEQRHWAGLVGELSAGVLDTPAERLDATIDETIRRMLDPLAADCVYLGRFSDDEDGAVQTHAGTWKPPGGPGDAGSVAPSLPYCEREIRRGHVVGVSRLEDLPAAGIADQRALRAAGVQAMLVVPMRERGGHTLGFVALLRCGRGRAWSEELVERTQLVGDLLALALLRRENDLAGRLRTDPRATAG
jgi:GAF domain